MTRFRCVPFYGLGLTLLAALLASGPVLGAEPDTSAPQEKARYHVYVRGVRCGQLLRQKSFDDVNEAIRAVEELRTPTSGQDIVIGFSVKATPDEAISRVEVYGNGCKAAYTLRGSFTNPLNMVPAMQNAANSFGKPCLVFVSPPGR